MKTIKSKPFYEYTKKISVGTPFGEQKVAMCAFVEYASETVGHDQALDFAICYDKLQEDWGFTENLGIYAFGEVVDLLVNANPNDYEDLEWKANIVKQLKAWLKQLGEK